MNNPPPNRHQNPRYVGRDWRDVAIGELLQPDEVKWAELDTSVQEATKVRWCLYANLDYRIGPC